MFYASFGVALRSGTTLLAPTFFQSLHLPWRVDLLADQQTGGAVGGRIGELPTLILALLVILTWLRSDGAESKRPDRQANGDDNAKLKADNAHPNDLSGPSNSAGPSGPTPST